MSFINFLILRKFLKGLSVYFSYHEIMIYAGLGETIAYIALVPITKYLGRRMGMIFSLGLCCICFLLGMIPWQWSVVWSFERLMNMVAIVGASCAFALVFLYTNELAPTTHRGLVMSSCSVVARFGELKKCN